MVRGTEQARAVSKRKAILDAASRLMVAEGLRRVTHRQVAAEAGVPVGSIGYYYSSRDKLIAACFDDFHRRRARVAEERTAATSTASGVDAVAEGILAIVTAGHPDALGGLLFAVVDASREQRDAGSSQIKEQATDTLQLIDEYLRHTGHSDLSAREIGEVIFGAAIMGTQVGENPRDAAGAALVRTLGRVA